MRQFEQDGKLDGFFSPNGSSMPEYLEPVLDGLDNIINRRQREGEMDRIDVTWNVIDGADELPESPPVRQVYTWLLTSDKKVVIVSKDGEHWQLPGGKPNKDESVQQTAIRETREETGLNITDRAGDIEFFGTYTIHERDPAVDVPENYQQVRSLLHLGRSSEELHLTSEGESTTQRPEDAIRFVRTVAADKVPKFIPWMPKTDEWKTLKRRKII